MSSVAAIPQHAAHKGHQQHKAAGTGPTLLSQDAFGAIQQIVKLLEADPTTDWSKVNIRA
jgi:hypothetical protein